ncbi:DUF6498-containing protein [Dokdonella sp.]|uniref:DUF6498-containing protein n=1 Tax=Dokdonella sp. TaxID=2291710 RepID=UPI003783E2F2
MPDPRDYQRFLKAAASDKTTMRGLQHLLPAPPPAARLWSQAALIVASSVVPLVLWLAGRLAPVDVILLYLAEGCAYGLAVIARVLVTAAAPTDGKRPRVLTALRYAIHLALLWGGLGLGLLECIAPKPDASSMHDWLAALLLRFAQAPMALAALGTTAFLLLDVVRRGDYIDAYLDFGPRETARYGFTYPFALIFLLGSALLVGVFVLHTDDAFVQHGTPLVAPAFFAFWLIGWRLFMQLSNLTLPVWGRGLGRFEERVARAVGEPPANEDGG